MISVSWRYQVTLARLIGYVANFPSNGSLLWFPQIYTNYTFSKIKVHLNICIIKSQQRYILGKTGSYTEYSETDLPCQMQEHSKPSWQQRKSRMDFLFTLKSYSCEGGLECCCNDLWCHTTGTFPISHQSSDSRNISLNLSKASHHYLTIVKFFIETHIHLSSRLGSKLTPSMDR